MFGFFSTLPLLDLDPKYFWKWNVFEDYLLFCFGLSALCAMVTTLLLDSAVFVEMLGSLAVMFEAMLGLPQLLQNFHNRSTKGMRYRGDRSQIKIYEWAAVSHPFSLSGHMQFQFPWTKYANQVIYNNRGMLRKTKACGKVFVCFFFFYTHNLHTFSPWHTKAVVYYYTASSCGAFSMKSMDASFEWQSVLGAGSCVFSKANLFLTLQLYNTPEPGSIQLTLMHITTLYGSVV